MNWKFDIVDLIVVGLAGFIAGFAVRPFLTSFPTGAGPPIPVLQGFSSPSSRTSAGAGLKVGPESGPNDFNAGEANCPTENQYSLSSQLIRKAASTKVTAYCPCEKCCGKWSDGYTASGHKIKKGDRFVAAAKKIPFGTMLIIPEYNNGKPVPVLDRGGVIRGDRLDVFFNSHKEALEWGVKKWPY